MRFSIIYNKGINSLIRTLLRPFSSVIPSNLKFAINGSFIVRGNNVPPFKIITNPTSAVAKYLFWGNIEGFEFSSVRIFCELVKESKVFFDIGSNIGYYSLLASSIKNKNIKVYSFEPMPSAFDYLLKNININGFVNIEPKKLALSNEKGTATFYSITNLKFKEMSQLTGDGGLSEIQSGERSKICFEVQTQTLDNFVSDNLGELKIDLIKIDTEAHEHYVLYGASNVLKEHRPIIQCEILKNQVEIEIEAALYKYDYLYFRATDLGLELVESFSNNKSNFVDYYLVPKEKRELVKNFVI